VDPALVAESPFAIDRVAGRDGRRSPQRRERWAFSYVIVGADDVDSFAPVVAELAGR
jgi:hypothetical protein